MARSLINQSVIRLHWPISYSLALTNQLFACTDQSFICLHWPISYLFALDQSVIWQHTDQISQHFDVCWPINILTIHWSFRYLYDDILFDWLKPGSWSYCFFDEASSFFSANFLLPTHIIALVKAKINREKVCFPFKVLETNERNQLTIRMT